MVLKKIFLAVACMMLMGWSGLSVADEYRAGEFLGLDLPKALLSPRPLGPPATFAPGPLDVRLDRGSEGAQASVEPKAQPGTVASKVVTRKTRVAHAQVRAEKSHGAARGRLARRHGNPLDAQASDTRIQVWPCKSGGICNWKR